MSQAFHFGAMVGQLKTANLYEAGQATSQVTPKPCCTNKSNIGQLTGQVSSNNPGQQGKSAIDKSAVVAGGLIGAAIGASRAPENHKLEGAGRGAFRGAATDLGSYLGGAAGMPLGALLTQSPVGAALGGIGGAAVGGLGGYRLSGKMLNKPSWEPKETANEQPAKAAQLQSVLAHTAKNVSVR